MALDRPRSYVFLQPGLVCVRADGVDIVTILGSCVAVCVYDAVRRVGGMNHFLLPEPQDGLAGPAPDTGRFGSLAVPHLVEAACEAGASRQRLVAAVIGGGSPVDQIRFGALGARNAEVALNALATYGVPVQRSETGGAHGRRLTFGTHTGSIQVERVQTLRERGAGVGPS